LDPRNPEKSEIPEFPGPPPRKPEKPENREKGPKITPAKTTYDEKVGVLIKTPVLVQKTPPLKPVRNFGVRNLSGGSKKVQKTPPLKPLTIKKWVCYPPVLGPKNPPAKTG